MKQFFIGLFRFLGILVIIGLTVLLVLEIKEDTLEIKKLDEEAQNIQIESEYYINLAMSNLDEVKGDIEKDINAEVELADTGALSQIDIYFVTKVDNQYRYIVKRQVDGVDKFVIAQDSNEDGKYILSLEALGLKDNIYTKIENYNVDKDGLITYVNSN